MNFKVLGSKDFLNMPIGTFYTELNIKNKSTIEEQIIQIIKYIKSGLGWFDLYIDNYGSLAFGDPNIDYITENVLDPENHFIWDHNIIGDAIPETTLYLIIPEEIIPDEVDFDDIHLTKNEILKIRDNLINSVTEEYRDNFKNPNNKTARMYIESEYKNHPVVNYNKEIEVNI